MERPAAKCGMAGGGARQILFITNQKLGIDLEKKYAIIGGI